MKFSEIFSRAGLISLGAFAAASLAIATPANAKGGRDKDVVIDIDGEGELLERLIEMDAADIADMRNEFEEAYDEIIASIAEIEDARQEVKGVPGGRLILKIAFAAARSGAAESANVAIDEARTAVAQAETDLKVADVSAAEKAETADAIDAVRDGLDLIEDALGQLFDAMTA